MPHLPLPGPTRRSLMVILLLGSSVLLLALLVLHIAPVSAQTATPTASPTTPTPTRTGGPRPEGVSRVSVASDGTWSNGDSIPPAPMSADGRFVVFYSSASNLLVGNTEDLPPGLFLHDRQTGETSWLVYDREGNPARAECPALSADGRFVAFLSRADNLVPTDTNEQDDVFVLDRETSEITRVSVASDGTQSNDSFSDCYYGGVLLISGDGRIVVFDSAASNLVPGDTNDERDVFAHDRETGETTRVSVASDGRQIISWGAYASALSADGNIVVFVIEQPLEKDIFVHDRRTGATTPLSLYINQWDALSFHRLNDIPYVALSADGRFVAFSSYTDTLVPDDTNEASDVFVYDRETHATTRVSVASDGLQGDGHSSWPSLSADGRFVAFFSSARNLADSEQRQSFFIHDRLTSETFNVPVPVDSISSLEMPLLSADGRSLSFHTDNNHIVPEDVNDDSDIFVYERALPTAPPPTATPGPNVSPSPTTTPTPVRSYFDITDHGYADMAPGSAFSFVAPGLPPGAPVQIALSGPETPAFADLATLTVPDKAPLVFTLQTPPDAATGTYTTRVSVDAEQVGLAESIVHEEEFVIGADLRFQDDRPVFTVPIVTFEPAQLRVTPTPTGTATDGPSPTPTGTPTVGLPTPTGTPTVGPNVARDTPVFLPFIRRN